MSREYMREDCIEKVKQYIDRHRMFPQGSHVVIGVSGGADSVCLLHLLWRIAPEYGLKLHVVHVNHGVREDAGEDASYVEELCRKLSVPFVLREVFMEQYARDMGLSPEEAGRILRYRCFEELLEQEKAAGAEARIAVAHTANDRAETMLFQMFRGSGLKGLCSIPAVRSEIVRPILCLMRSEVEEYLAQQGLEYREDSTNQQDAYARNRIRHHILPYAEKEICSGATAHMGELADLLCETEAYLEEQTKLSCQRCVIKSGNAYMADLAAFRKEPPVLQKRILLFLFEQLTPHRKDITRQHIENLCALIQKEGCKELDFPYSIRARKEYDRLCLERVGQESVQGESASLHFSFHIIDREDFFHENGENIPENRYTKWFDYDKISSSMQWRQRQPGDYLTIDAALHKKSLKEYMINEKIPKWQREQIQVLADGSHIMWVPGYRISQYYKVDENTRRILEVRLGGGKDGRESGSSTDGRGSR